jgi:hypothetical protein
LLVATLAWVAERRIALTAEGIVFDGALLAAPLDLDDRRQRVR